MLLIMSGIDLDVITPLLEYIYQVKMLLVLSGMDLAVLTPLLEYTPDKDVVSVVAYGSGYGHTTPGV